MRRYHPVLRERASGYTVEMTTNNEFGIYYLSAEVDEVIAALTADVKNWRDTAGHEADGLESWKKEAARLTAETTRIYSTDCWGNLNDHNGRVGTSDESSIVYAVRILNRQAKEITVLKDNMSKSSLKLEAENSVLREQNSAMNASLVKLRPEVENMRKFQECMIKQTEGGHNG